MNFIMLEDKKQRTAPPSLIVLIRSRRHHRRGRGKADVLPIDSLLVALAGRVHELEIRADAELAEMIDIRS